MVATTSRVYMKYVYTVYIYTYLYIYNIYIDLATYTPTIDGRNPKQPPGMYRTERKELGYLPYTLVIRQISEPSTISRQIFGRWKVHMMPVHSIHGTNGTCTYTDPIKID